MAVCDRASGPAGLLVLQPPAPAAPDGVPGPGQYPGGTASGPGYGDAPPPLPFPGDMPPAKLMYGVPPGQFKKIDLENKESTKKESR